MNGQRDGIPDKTIQADRRPSINRNGKPRINKNPAAMLTLLGPEWLNG